MNLDAMRAFRLPPVDHAYEARDSILYALGLGYGSDPLDPAQLQFVYEGALKAVPSMVNILAHPGMWVKRPELGIAWPRLLHSDQSFELLRPLPPSGRLRGEYTVTAVEDLGRERGARLHMRKTLTEPGGAVVATVNSTYLLRGDGGAGGFGTPGPAPAPVPDRAPDQVVTLRSLPQQALLYRLSGDWNPLHADPSIASAAGFARPILHGLCSMGLAARALIAAAAPMAPERLRSLSLRFARPVYPGDEIEMQIHRTGPDSYAFRARVPARDEIVLDRGHAVLHPVAAEAARPSVSVSG